MLLLYICIDPSHIANAAHSAMTDVNSSTACQKKQTEIYFIIMLDNNSISIYVRVENVSITVIRLLKKFH